MGCQPSERGRRTAGERKIRLFCPGIGYRLVRVMANRRPTLQLAGLALNLIHRDRALNRAAVVAVGWVYILDLGLMGYPGSYPGNVQSY